MGASHDRSSGRIRNTRIRSTPTTTVSYTLEPAGEVTLRVYNVLAKEKVRLVDGRQTAGAHQFLSDASTLPSNACFYTSDSGAYRVTRTMVLP